MNTGNNPNCFDPEYAAWYQKTYCGGRKPITVGELLEVLKKLPADMPVKVSHQFNRHSVGIHDPICGERSIAVFSGVTSRGAPTYSIPEGGLKEFVIE